MIGNKIKALLNIRNIETKTAYEQLDLMQQSFSRKINNNNFKTDELIKLADISDTQLAFIDKKTKQPLITFDKDDLEKENND